MKRIHVINQINISFDLPIYLVTKHKLPPKSDRLLGEVNEFVTLGLHSRLADLFDLELLPS